MAPAFFIEAAPFAFLVTFLVLYGMTHGLNSWLGSQLNALAHPQGSLVKRTLLLPVSALAIAIGYVMRTTGHAISQAAAHSVPVVARYVEGWSLWITHNATAVGDFAWEVASGFERLTAHTIPRAVHKAIAVPLHEVQIGLRHTERELAQLRRYARGIDTLLRDTVWPALRRVAHAVDVTIPHSIGGVRARVGAAERAISHPSRAWIKRVWKAGWILVGAGLVLKFLLKKFPWLFCRNTTNAAKAICGMDASLLASLLAVTAELDGVNLHDFCRTLQAVEDDVVGAIHGFVEIGS